MSTNAYIPAFVPSTFNAYSTEYYALLDVYCRERTKAYRGAGKYDPETPELAYACDRLKHMELAIPAWAESVTDMWNDDNTNYWEDGECGERG
jgi:hypothetical protein